jgi:hypothetical protein
MPTTLNNLKYANTEIERRLKEIYDINNPGVLFALREPSSVTNDINAIMNNIDTTVIDSSMSDSEVTAEMINKSFKLLSDAIRIFEIIPIKTPFSMGNVLHIFLSIIKETTNQKYKHMLNLVMKCIVFKTIKTDDKTNVDDIRHIMGDIITDYNVYTENYAH